MSDKQEALAYIARRSWKESRLGLSRITALLGLLGNPQDKVPCVHIAGTNGKSSTAAMLASVLSAAGYKTGLFTSPYIRRFNERMQVDGAPVSDEDIVALTAQVRRHADAMDDHPTEFEMVTAMGFLYFAQQGCDVLVLEVGLGGRLDATNVIPTPALAVITAIALDHTEILGDTLEAIAAEKGGIIKPGGQVLAYPQSEAVLAVWREQCAAQGATLHVAGFEGLQVEVRSPEGQVFTLPPYTGLRIGLLGSYQPQNAAVVVQAARLLGGSGFAIPEDALRQGLASARWPARFQLARRSPDVIVDGGHNPQGAAALARSLADYFPGRPVVFVAGVMADKDYAAMFAALRPLAKAVYCVTPDNPRALAAEALAEQLAQLGFGRVAACRTVADGVDAALAAAGPQDVVCAFGSLYMAGEVLARLEEL